MLFYHECDLDTHYSKERNVVNNIVENPNQFEHLLHYNSTFCPGCHMIRVSMMKRANPKMDIFEVKHGRNFQMLLPIYYFFLGII